ncbi:MAG: alpha/beta hydrolase family protein [Acidimicrobiales bacterium]
MGERDLRFPTTAGLSLAGTVATPEGAPPPEGWPGLVLVLGSYPATRDGNPDCRQGWFSPAAPRRNMFRTLAASLAARGVATLRYDKRGCGESEGDYDDVDFEALVDDARAGAAALAAQLGVASDRIGLLGQSEGGVIVLEAARRDPAVAAVLTQGSPGRGLFETRSDEAASLADTVEALDPGARRAFLEAEPGAYLFMKCSAQIRDGIRAGLKRAVLSSGGQQVTINLDWIRQHLAHPADRIAAQLQVPLAFFSGELDRNVHPDNAEHLAAVARNAGNANVTLRIFAGLDHGMRPAPADAREAMEAMVRLGPSAPTDPSYLAAVAEWTLSALAPGQVAAEARR